MKWKWKEKYCPLFCFFRPFFTLLILVEEAIFYQQRKKKKYLPQISNQSNSKVLHVSVLKKSLYSNSEIKFKSGHIPQLQKHPKKIYWNSPIVKILKIINGRKYLYQIKTFNLRKTRRQHTLFSRQKLKYFLY